MARRSDSRRRSLLHEPAYDPLVDVPPELTAEEFGREILDGGADAAALLLGSLVPGPRAVELLDLLKPASLSPASMVSVISATEKLASWVQARQHRWLAAFACPGVSAPVGELRAYASQPGQPLHPRKSPAEDRATQDDDLDHSGSAVHGDPDVEMILKETAMKVAAAEVGAALHFSPIAAQRRVCQAVEFAVDLPATLRALEAGTIDRGRSLTIADRTQNLPAELRRKVERAVLPKATNRTPGQLRGIIDRAVISVDPAAAKKRQVRALTQRNVTHRAGEDGMGIFRAELSADKAQLAYSVIDQLAYQLKRGSLCETDPRGVGALRADVFSDLIDQLASTGTVTIRTTLRCRASNTGATPARPDTGGSADPIHDLSDADFVQEPLADADSVSKDDSCSSDPSTAAARSGSGGPGCDDRCASGECGNGETVNCFFGGECCRDDRRTSDDKRADDKRADDNCADDNCADGDVCARADQGCRDQSAGAEVCSKATVDARSFGTGLGTHHGRFTHLNVTIAASTLAGLDERPGELDGHGPIPADLARAIAASASTIAAIAIKPGCGTPLDLGRTV